MHEEQSQPESKTPNTDNLWDTTRKTIQEITSKASRYTKLAQRKVDQALLQKKLAAAHTELGKALATARAADPTSPLDNPQVQAALQSLDTLQATAARLRAEIEQLSTDAPPVEADPSDSPTQ